MELYIHIPFCVKKCNYCDFLSGTSTEAERSRYTKALERELLYYAPKFKDTPVTSVFIGGGTPTFLETDKLISIMETVRGAYNLTEDCEVTIECNPKTASLESLYKYREVGINRISIGLQSVNEDELKALGRVHDFNDFLRTFENARKAGFNNINVDIMTALPGQTPEKLQKTLSSVYMLRPEHISAYDLIIEPGTPFYAKYHEDLEKREAGLVPEFLPKEETEEALTNLVEDFLTKHGYHQYEVSNFARPDRECRHNIGYWDRVPYLGVGIGAASLIEETRWSNERDIYKYMDMLLGDELCVPAVDVHTLSKKEAMEEFFFLGLRKKDGVSRSDFEEYFEVTVDSVYGDVIRRLKAEELLIEEAGRFYLTKRGMDVSNIVLAEFLLDEN